MHSYIIVGNGMKAMPVKSDLLFDELVDYIRSKSRLIHPESSDEVWTYGVIEFVNPMVLMPSDYLNRLPALIGIK